MKKFKFITATILLLAVTSVVGGCSNNKILNRLTEKGYFANSYDNAILQTDIASKITSHFAESSSVKKKAMLITVDGFRAESLEYIWDSDIGISRISKDGGLYWTKPANLESKSKVDMGVNFLSIVTGEEPSTFGVFKNTDVKRETPYSVMATMSEKYRVKFLTDNKNYIDKHLSAEFKVKASQCLNYVDCTDLNGVRKECLNNLDENDFIAVAISDPYMVADGNYKISNSPYLSAIIHLNYYLSNIYNNISTRSNEDWLVIVASTCGGKTKLALGSEEGNILTFMLSNKKMQ